MVNIHCWKNIIYINRFQLPCNKTTCRYGDLKKQKKLAKLLNWNQIESTISQEVEWASHLGLAAILFPPPFPPFHNYARMIEKSITFKGQIWIRVPMRLNSEVITIPNYTIWNNNKRENRKIQDKHGNGGINFGF